MMPLNENAPSVEKISFSIIKKNKIIGYVDIEKQSLNETTTFIINSEVNAKVIFNFNAIGNEKTIYKQDTLVYSSVYRKLNNKVKLNQSLSLIDGQYILINKNEYEVLNFNVIYRNLVTLFFNEPKGIKEVYSDKYKEMVKITPICNGKYKVVFPNNSTSIYQYDKGKCESLEVVGSFFKVHLLPRD